MRNSSEGKGSKNDAQLTVAVENSRTFAGRDEKGVPYIKLSLNRDENKQEIRKRRDKETETTDPGNRKLLILKSRSGAGNQ
jgi:hypothetical protein